MDLRRAIQSKNSSDVLSIIMRIMRTNELDMTHFINQIINGNNIYEIASLSDDSGYTALHQAIDAGKLPAVILLIRIASDFNQMEDFLSKRTENNETPLDLAIRKGNESIVRSLSPGFFIN